MGGQTKYISADKPCAVHLEDRIQKMLSRGAELTAGQIAQRLGLRRPSEALQVLARLEGQQKVRRLTGIRAGMWGRV